MIYKTKIHTDILRKILGTLDRNLIFIEKELNVHLSVLGGELVVQGDDEATELASELISHLVTLASGEEEITKLLISQCILLLQADRADEILELSREVVAVTARGKQIRCKTVGQHDYVRSISKNIVTFGIGPAGTGKTYLAVAMAVSAYKSGEVERIILTRPAIEAGEKLGFLPGDLQEKVDPYLRPLYDALSEMFGSENYMKLIERGIVEIAPLAYMRGRTLSNAFIILDEAQNTTVEQMKMFLTRLGDRSKVVVTGDVTQIDLPRGVSSGLQDAARVLAGVEGIAIRYFGDKDVVRHELVQRIVKAYEKAAAYRRDYE